MIVNHGERMKMKEMLRAWRYYKVWRGRLKVCRIVV
jgi:hypothetical protein